MRLLSSVMVLAMMLGLCAVLAGCGGGGDAGPAGPEGGMTTAETREAGPEGVRDMMAAKGKTKLNQEGSPGETE